MGTQRRRSDRAGRAAMRSPGRPSVGRREERQRFWAAIARGVSSEDAAGEAGVSAAVGVRWFRESGGMPTVTQAPLSGRYLSLAEREEVAILRARECGVREIARSLCRSPSTISRELRRNAATRGGALEYRATTAQWHADLRAKRPKAAKLATNSQLRGYVQDRLAGSVERPDGTAVAGPEVRWKGRRHGRRADRRWAKAWSPEQISHRLEVDGGIRGSAHHLKRPSGLLGCPADEGGRHDETVRARRARAGAGVGAVGRGHVVAGGRAQARRQAAVRASVCDFDGRGEAGSEEALEAMPV